MTMKIQSRLIQIFWFQLRDLWSFIPMLMAKTLGWMMIPTELGQLRDLHGRTSEYLMQIRDLIPTVITDQNEERALIRTRRVTEQGAYPLVEALADHDLSLSNSMDGARIVYVYFEEGMKMVGKSTVVR